MKKRVIWGIIAALLLQCVTFGTYVFADEIPITIWINGEKVESEVEPVTENDRTLVPLRAIFEAMGAEVSWDDASQTAKVAADGITIQVVIDDVVMKKNGEDVILDVPARLINDRTMVPVRAISEGIGADVDWNEEEQKVLITYQKQEDPIPTASITATSTAISTPVPTEKVQYGERMRTDELEEYNVTYYDWAEIETVPVRDTEGNILAYEKREKNGKLIGKAVHKKTKEKIALGIVVYTPDGINVPLISEDKVKLKENINSVYVNFTYIVLYENIKQHSKELYDAVTNNVEGIEKFVLDVWDEAFMTTVALLQSKSDFNYAVDFPTKKETKDYYKKIQQDFDMEGEKHLLITSEQLDEKYRSIQIEVLNSKEMKNVSPMMMCLLDERGAIRYFSLNKISGYGIEHGRYYIIENCVDKKLEKETGEIANIMQYYGACNLDWRPFKMNVQKIVTRQVPPRGRLEFRSDDE